MSWSLSLSGEWTSWNWPGRVVRICFYSVSSHPLTKWEVIYFFVHSVVIHVCLFLLGVITSLGEVRGCLFVCSFSRYSYVSVSARCHHIPWRSERLSICLFIQSLFPCVCFCSVSSHPLTKWEVVYLFVHSVVIPVCLFLLGVITSLDEVRGCLFACSISRYSRVSVSAGCHHIPRRSERLSICLFIQSLFPCVCFCSVSSHPLAKCEVVYLFVHSVVIPVWLFLLGVITSLDEVRGCLFACSFSRYSHVSVSARCHHIPWRSERLFVCLFIQSLFPCVCFCSVSSHPLAKWEVVYLLVHSVVIPMCLFLLGVITSLDEVRGCLFACSFSRYSHVSVSARCHHIPWRSERLFVCLFIQSLFPCVCFCSVSSHPLTKWEVVCLLVHSVVIPMCLFLLGVITSFDEVRGCLFACSFSRYSRVSVSARCHHIPRRSERLSICLFIQSLFPCVCFCSVSSHPLTKWEVVYLFVHSVVIPMCLFLLGVITSLDEVRGCLFACSFSRYSHVSVSARCHHFPWRSERMSICLFIQSLFPCFCFCSVSSHPLTKWEVVYLLVHSVVIPVCLFLLGVITSLDEVRGCLFVCSFSCYSRVSVSAGCHHIPWRSERLSIFLFIQSLFPCVCFCSVSSHPLTKWEVVFMFVHSVVIPMCLFLLGVITSLDEVRGCLFACSFSRYSRVSVSARCHHIPWRSERLSICSFSRYSRVSVSARCHHIPWRSERLSICLFIESLFPCVCFCSVSSHPLTKWEVVHLFVHSAVIPMCRFLLGVITSHGEVRSCLFVCSFSRYSHVSVSSRCHHIPWRSERLSICLFIQSLFPCVCYCSVSSHPLAKWEVVYLFVHSVVIPMCLFLLGVITSLDEVRGCLFVCSFSRYSRVSVSARCHHFPWRSESLFVSLFIQSLFPCVCFCSVSSHPLTNWEVVCLLVHSVVIPMCLFLLGVITSLDEMRGCLFACSFSRYSHVSVSARCHHFPWRSERLSICLFIQPLFPCVCFCSMSSHPLTKWEVVYLLVHSVVIPMCLFLLGVITSLDEVRGCLFVCSFSCYSHVSVSARCHHIPWRSERLSICLFIQPLFPCVCFCSVSSHPLTKWEVVYLLFHSVVIPMCLFLLGVITSLDEVIGCLFACSFSRYSLVSVSARCHHIPWRSERLSVCLFIQSLFPCVCFYSVSSHPFAKWEVVYLFVHSVVIPMCLFLLGVITSLDEVRGCLFVCSFSRYSNVSVSARCHHIPGRSERLSICLFIQPLFPCVCFCWVSSHPWTKWEVVYLFVHSVVIPMCLFLLGVITSLDEVRGCLFVCSFSRYSHVSVSARCHHIPWRSDRLSICLFIQSLFPCVCFCSVSSHPLTKWEVVYLFVHSVVIPVCLFLLGVITSLDEVRDCLFACSISRYSLCLFLLGVITSLDEVRGCLFASVVIPVCLFLLGVITYLGEVWGCLFVCSFIRYSRVSVSARCHHIPWRSERLSICVFIQSLFPCVCFCSVSSHPLTKWEVVYLFVHSVVIPICLFLLGVITSLDEVRGCLFVCSFSRYSRVSVSARCHHIPWRSERLSICLFIQSLFPCVCFCSVSSHPLAKWEVVYLFSSFSCYSRVSVYARCHHIPWRSERLSICLFIQSLFLCVCFCWVSSHPLTKWEDVYLLVHSVVISLFLFLLGVITSLDEVRGCLFACSFSRHSRVSVSARCHHFPWRSERLSICLFIQLLFPCVCFCWVSSHPLTKWEVVYFLVHSVVIPMCLFLLGVITSLDEVRDCLYVCSFSRYSHVSVSARCHHIPWRSERLFVCLFIQSLFPCVCFCSVSSHPLTKWEVVYLFIQSLFPCVCFCSVSSHPLAKWEVVYLFVHWVVIPVCLFLLGVITSLDEVRGCLFVCSFSRYSHVSVSSRCHHIPWRSERLSICLFIQSLFPCVCFYSVSSHPLTKWEVVYLFVHSVVIPVCLFLLGVITSLGEVRGCLFVCSFSRYSYVSVSALYHHIPWRSERLSICLFIQSLFPCVCFCSVSSLPLTKWEVVCFLVHSVVIPMCLFLLSVITSLDELRGCLFAC